MHLTISVLFATLLCCVLYAKAAPLSGNDIPNSSMKTLFLKTRSRYENFMKSPEPYYTLVSARALKDIKEISARNVTPQGVVVRKCPEKIGFRGNEKRCKAIDSEMEEMVLEVYLAKGRVMKHITVEHETKCECL
ncbi:uncharacterized protein [Onthophagus taurus]|uniref:uncharacterized protein n=1 Tax=Onthophagus taurus TaxID=166361 RepID=UPI000C20A7F4|nr:uncharacterized protein LOC111414751 [Onthophagus taurus]